MKSMSFYFDENQSDILSKIAKEQKRSKSQMLSVIIEEYIDSYKKQKTNKNKEVIETIIKTHTKDAINHYSECFEDKHNVKYKCTGKDAGCFKRLVKDIGIGDLIELISAYFELPDATLEQKRHPVSGLEARLNEVRVYAETGQYMTQQQAYNINKQIKASKKKEKKPEDESFPF